MREIITLQCGECKNRNYTTTKNKKKHSERMETKKFCRACRKHTPHKEPKKSDRDLALLGVKSARGRMVLVLGESSNGQDSGLQNRVWGFESVLPCQVFVGRELSGSCG